MNYATLALALLLAGVQLPLSAQTPPTDASGSAFQVWNYHVRKTIGPGALAGSAAFAGAMQMLDTPEAWPKDTSGYGKRFASTFGSVGTRHLLEFGLDRALGEDPKYRPARTGTSYVAHAFASEFVEQRSTGRRIAFARIGAIVAAAGIAQLWYPKSSLVPNAPGLGTRIGQNVAITVGFDVLGNLATELLPSVRKKLFGF